MSEDNDGRPGDDVSESVPKTVDKVQQNTPESQSSSLKRLQQAEFEKINENEEFYPASNGQLPINRNYDLNCGESDVRRWLKPRI